MLVLAGLACFLVGVVAALAAVGLLGLALTPQDAGVSATGRWGYALVPAAVALAAFWCGFVLWRRAWRRQPPARGSERGR